MSSKIFAALVCSVVALVALGGSVGPFVPYIHGRPTMGTVTTIEDLIAGRFHTALDKEGAGGTLVTVEGLYVIDVHNESDGDWHVTVTDGKVPLFITEITPAYEAAIGRPPIGATIDETGSPYCDVAHENESWHGDTCWEIHPITSWKISAYNLTSTFRPPSGLNASTTFGKSPVLAGSNQTIVVRVTGAGGPLPNQTVFIRVAYASGLTTLDFACVTDASGTCSISWTIGRDQMPGVYQVTVEIGLVRFDSTFEVSPS